MCMNTVERVKKIVKETVRTSKNQSVAHKWGHILRVHDNAMEIAKHYGEVDLQCLQLAALLHDIAQPYYDKKSHVASSMKKARQILNDLNVDKKTIDKVANIIREHSTEQINDRPSSIEAKILFDADKLDGLGAIGIARVFAYCGQRGMSPEEAIQWYFSKIDIAAPNIQTSVGAKMVRKKLSYVEKFLSKLKQEAKSKEVLSDI